MPEGSPPPVMPGIAMHLPPHGPPPHGPPMAHVPMGGSPQLPPRMTEPPPRPRALKILLVVAIICALAGVAAVAAFFIHRELTRPAGEGTVAQAPAAVDAGPAATITPDGGESMMVAKGADAAPEDIEIDMVDAAEAMVVLDAMEVIDAGAPAVPVDAAADETAPPDPGTADKLVIKSEPAGARVFLDGADAGKTPVTLAASSDRHTVAIVLPGYDLHLAEIDGRGTHAATLQAVTPSEGPGGIKVRCKADDRYYVFLNGKPTGQLCPTERLGVDRGEHALEVYDLVSETRRQFNVKVKELKFSVRVRVD